MRHPTQPEERMIHAVMEQATLDALKHGQGSGCFHGFLIRAQRIRQRNLMPGELDQVRIVIIHGSECLGELRYQEGA